jgi:hypothetical protein
MFRFRLRLLMLLPLLGAGLLLAPAPQASAAAQPPTDWSFYVETTNTNTLYQLGCNQVKYDESVHYNSFVILDFGGLYDDSGDQELITNTVISPTEVWYLATYFAAGYTNCRANNTTYVSLAVGTNNSIPLDYNKGSSFASTVTSISGWNNTYEYHVDTWGALDLETWGTYSVTSGQAYNWYSGYSAHGGPSYINYGSADGCPSAGIGPACSYNWNQGDYYNLSWLEPLAWSVPEIYYQVNSEQWYWIGDDGSGQSRGWIEPWAPLDQNDLSPGSNTSAQAWNDLQYFFCQVNACGIMYFSMEMHNSGA